MGAIPISASHLPHLYRLHCMSNKNWQIEELKVSTRLIIDIYTGEILVLRYNWDFEKIFDSLTEL